MQPATEKQAVETCVQCGEEKPLDDFYRRASGRLCSRKCRECRKAEERARQAEATERDRDRYAVDPEFRHRKREAAKRYQRKHYIKRVRGRDLQRKYGISQEEYDLMYHGQQGCCKICGVHQSATKRSLSVDHMHDNGFVRGLLCDGCNRGIGMLKDDPEILQRAAEYVHSSGFTG